VSEVAGHKLRLGQLRLLLDRLAVHEIPHDIANLRVHLEGVYAWLRRLGAPEAVQLAGLAHSLYGAESYSGLNFGLERAELEAVVGAEVERIVHLYGSLVTASAEASIVLDDPAWLWDRFTDEPIVIDNTQFRELIWLLFCNSLEKEARLAPARALAEINEETPWADSDPASGPAWMPHAQRLGPKAFHAWKVVFGGGTSLWPAPNKQGGESFISLQTAAALSFW
jgi:hypothetical protein